MQNSAPKNYATYQLKVDEEIEQDIKNQLYFCETTRFVDPLDFLDVPNIVNYQYSNRYSFLLGLVNFLKDTQVPYLKKRSKKETTVLMKQQLLKIISEEKVKEIKFLDFEDEFDKFTYLYLLFASVLGRISILLEKTPSLIFSNENFTTKKTDTYISYQNTKIKKILIKNSSKELLKFREKNNQEMVQMQGIIYRETLEGMKSKLSTIRGDNINGKNKNDDSDKKDGNDNNNNKDKNNNNNKNDSNKNDNDNKKKYDNNNINNNNNYVRDNNRRKKNNNNNSHNNNSYYKNRKGNHYRKHSYHEAYEIPYPNNSNNGQNNSSNGDNNNDNDDHDNKKEDCNNNNEKDNKQSIKQKDNYNNNNDNNHQDNNNVENIMEQALNETYQEQDL
jgi:hypothetical protein